MHFSLDALQAAISVHLCPHRAETVPSTVALLCDGDPPTDIDIAEVGHVLAAMAAPDALTPGLMPLASVELYAGTSLHTLSVEAALAHPWLGGKLGRDLAGAFSIAIVEPVTNNPTLVADLIEVITAPGAPWAWASATLIRGDVVAIARYGFPATSPLVTGVKIDCNALRAIGRALKPEPQRETTIADFVAAIMEQSAPPPAYLNPASDTVH